MLLFPAGRSMGSAHRRVTISPLPTLIVFFALLLIGVGAITLMASSFLGVPFAASVSLLGAGPLIIAALALTTILCSAFPTKGCYVLKRALEV